MALTDTQLETLARDLLTIARCARTLHAQLQPGHQAGDGVWHRPVYGPKPPCSITVLDLLHEAETVLAGWLGNLAHDYLGEHVDGAVETPRAWAARRDRTAHDMANRLYEQRHLLASREYAHDAADEIAQQARTLADRAEPPPPTKPPTIPREEVFATAGDLAPVISDITGRTITRKQITYWGRAGYIARRGGAGDEQVYRLADVLDHAQKE